jgi:hypothetical protein
MGLKYWAISGLPMSTPASRLSLMPAGVEQLLRVEHDHYGPLDSHRTSGRPRPTTAARSSGRSNGGEGRAPDFALGAPRRLSPLCGHNGKMSATARALHPLQGRVSESPPHGGLRAASMSSMRSQFQSTANRSNLDQCPPRTTTSRAARCS